MLDFDAMQTVRVGAETESALGVEAERQALWSQLLPMQAQTLLANGTPHDYVRALYHLDVTLLPEQLMRLHAQPVRATDVRQQIELGDYLLRRWHHHQLSQRKLGEMPLPQTTAIVFPSTVADWLNLEFYGRYEDDFYRLALISKRLAVWVTLDEPANRITAAEGRLLTACVRYLRDLRDWQAPTR